MNHTAATGDRQPRGRAAHRDHRIVVIAVGNRGRGDDGIAAAVVERIDDQRITTMVCEGELVTVPLCWCETDDVVIVDACRSGRPAGTLVELDPDDVDAASTLSTHGFGVVESLALARRLDLLPWRLRLFAIEGRQFGHGPISPELGAAVPRLASELVTTLVAARG